MKSKINDFINRFQQYNPIIRTKNDIGYEWLYEENQCVEIPNPNLDKHLKIEFQSNGETTVVFCCFHAHYSIDDGIYDFMCQQISDILNNKSCAAVLFCGEEKEWKGSTLLNSDDVQLPDKEIFDFILENDRSKKQLLSRGGEARFDFWDNEISRKLKMEEE